MSPDDAVAHHSAKARLFDRNYDEAPDFRQRQAVFSELIAAHGKPGCRVLDAGCGSGRLAAVAAARGMEVTCVDASPEMLDAAREKMTGAGLTASFIRSDILEMGERLPGGYDLVVCSSVLEYVGDLAGAGRVLEGLLAPGGTILVSMPNSSSLYRRLEGWRYRLTGTPDYFRHVRWLLTPSGLDPFFPKLKRVATRYFASPWDAFSRFPLAANLFVSAYRG
jgi:2-polyprenyl-3-methyl-5-hydroxy-6-metoxy-1,4-benzoquinol methylase